MNHTLEMGFMMRAIWLSGWWSAMAGGACLVLAVAAVRSASIARDARIAATSIAFLCWMGALVDGFESSLTHTTPTESWFRITYLIIDSLGPVLILGAFNALVSVWLVIRGLRDVRTAKPKAESPPDP